MASEQSIRKFNPLPHHNQVKIAMNPFIFATWFTLVLFSSSESYHHFPISVWFFTVAQLWHEKNYWNLIPAVSVCHSSAQTLAPQAHIPLLPRDSILQTPQIPCHEHTTNCSHAAAGVCSLGWKVTAPRELGSAGPPPGITHCILPGV